MENEPKRQRRWLQFSLRTLIIFTAVVAILCGWLGRKIERRWKERVAVDALVKSGAFVLYDYQMEDSSAKPPGSDWLRGLLGENFFPRS
jgi:hypothetical protein